MVSVQPNTQTGPGAPANGTLAFSSQTAASPTVAYEPISQKFDQISANNIDLSASVNKVSNTDSTVTSSPTTGNVVVSVNVAHVFAWTAVHTWTPAVDGSWIINSQTLGVAVFTLNTATGALTTLHNTLDDGSGRIVAALSISPGNNVSGGSVSTHLFSCTGSPQGNVTGVAGDYCLRVDGGVSTHLYICTGTTNWTGII